MLFPLWVNYTFSESPHDRMTATAVRLINGEHVKFVDVEEFVTTDRIDMLVDLERIAEQTDLSVQEVNHRLFYLNWEVRLIPATPTTPVKEVEPNGT